MSKSRKMLSNTDIPAVEALFKLIPAQSKATVANWAVGYAERSFVSIWSAHYPDDTRPQDALAAARACLEGKIKLTELKAQLSQCRGIAHDADDSPAAQAAVRAIVDCATGAVYNPSKSIGIALYGALAVAYHKLGATAPWAQLELLATQECALMLAALQAVAIENEPNPCKVSWVC
ncbi:MAG: hypothetical protein LBU67_08390 [Oscillospiraceae bacterium]|jgi:hypothetical protein|nr:hypothetical protein [Oscillospiraceae bacterium]